MRHTKGFVSIGLAIALAGCVQQPPARDILKSEVRPAPVCTNDKQCSAMWARAIDSVQKLTRMRIMTASETFIQTFPTQQIGFMNAQVYKQSLGDGRYQINGKFDCGMQPWCRSLLNRSIDIFNSDVAGFE